jgi:putative ABC transport system permease protein
LQFPGSPKTNPPPAAEINLAFPGYFEAIGIPLVRGRTFTDGDRNGSPPIAVIDTTFAQRYFPGKEPIGKLVQVVGDDAAARIVGIVGSVHNSDLGGPEEPEIYYPALQKRTESAFLVLRTNGDIESTATVRAAISRLNPGVALYDVESMGDRVAGSLRLRRFIAFLLDGMAIVGVMLALVGLYGSLAHLVEHRRREIGIRIALGAQRAEVSWIVLRQGVRLVLVGVVLGIGIAVSLARLVTNMFFGASAHDPLTFVCVAILLMAVAMLACYIPARRAMRVDPMVALRHD